MVDIEIGRARVYFSVGNRAKMGVGRLGVVKCSLWGQNNIILAIISFFFFFFVIQRSDRHSVVLSI